MDAKLIESMTAAERETVLRLHAELAELIDKMIDSFGFEENEENSYRGDIMRATDMMNSALETLRPELMDDFNAVFDRITMVYFEPERFFDFMGEYRGADGQIQLDGRSIGEFYGRTMASLAKVKSDFEARFAGL